MEFNKLLLDISRGLVGFYALVGLLFLATNDGVEPQFAVQIAVPYLYTIYVIVVKMRETDNE